MNKETTRQVGEGLCGNIIIDPEKIDRARRDELRVKELSFYEREDWKSARQEDVKTGKKIFELWTMEDPRQAQIIDLKIKSTSYRKDTKSVVGPLEREEVEVRIEEIKKRIAAILQEMLEGV